MGNQTDTAPNGCYRVTSVHTSTFVFDARAVTHAHIHAHITHLAQVLFLYRVARFQVSLPFPWFTVLDAATVSLRSERTSIL